MKQNIPRWPHAEDDAEPKGITLKGANSAKVQIFSHKRCVPTPRSSLRNPGLACPRKLTCPKETRLSQGDAGLLPCRWRDLHLETGCLHRLSPEVSLERSCIETSLTIDISQWRGACTASLLTVSDIQSPIIPYSPNSWCGLSNNVPSILLGVRSIFTTRCLTLSISPKWGPKYPAPQRRGSVVSWGKIWKGERKK